MIHLHCDHNLVDIGDIKVLKTDQIKSVSKRIIDANRVFPIRLSWDDAKTLWL